MGDVTYKQYSPEESEIYNAAIAKIREEMAKGRAFTEACSSIEVPDDELRAFILDDALKIMIADLHFVKEIPLQDVARTLGLPLARIVVAGKEMIQDVEISAVEAYRRSHPDSPLGNA
jgi:hypothetical protein